MAKAAKLAANSLLTTDDQVRLYAEAVSREAADRQVRLAKLEKKQCVCAPRQVKRKWEGSDKLTLRSVHDKDCPKWKPWMASSQKG